MNILHVGNIRNLQYNGVCVVVPKILESQSKIANVTLLNLSNYVPENSKNNYRVLPIEGIKDSLDEVMVNANLIVFHEFYWHQYIKLYKKAVILGIPYIILPHGSTTQYAQKVKKIKKYAGNILYFNKFAKNASAIHYLSNKEKKESIYPFAESFVVGNGIEIHKERKKRFSINEVKLIYIGRIDPYIKGLDILIESLKLIKKTDMACKVKVTIAGTGTYKNVKYIKDLIDQYQLNEIVKLEDAIYGQAKINKLMANDCFIQLSRTEAQPLGLMEAMSLGMPAIATPGTTFYEIVKNENVGIPVLGDPMEVSNTIVDIINGKYILENICKNSSRYIIENYNWKTISHTTLEKYKYVLTNRIHKETR